MRDKTDKGYHRLLIWKKSYELVLEIYEITKTFPKAEEYGLTSQIRRASVSIVLNIVEGYRRNGKKEFLHFLNISQSSLAELEAALELSFGLKFIDNESYQKIDNLVSEMAYLLAAFMTSIKKP